MRRACGLAKCYDSDDASKEEAYRRFSMDERARGVEYRVGKRW